MRISYTERVTNDEVLRRVGQDRALLGLVKSRKLKHFISALEVNSIVMRSINSRFTYLLLTYTRYLDYLVLTL